MKEEENYAHINRNLLSFIAHECRGPFNGLIGFSELLYTNTPPLSPDQHESYTELVHQLAVKSFMNVQSLIVWIKLLSNNLPIQTGIVNYDELLQNINAALKVDLISKNIELSIPQTPITIKGDQQLLAIAYSNLLYSTFRYIGENTVVQIEVNDVDRSLSIQLPHSAKFELLFQNTVSNPSAQNEQNFRIWIALQISNLSNIELSITPSNDPKLTIIKLSPTFTE